jgi:hypothetical protein
MKEMILKIKREVRMEKTEEVLLVVEGEDSLKIEVMMGVEETEMAVVVMMEVLLVVGREGSSKIEVMMRVEETEMAVVVAVL